MLKYETEAGNKGYRCVMGVDEAGRGPLAGPVVAAAVFLPPGVTLDGLDDSKKLSQKLREKFYSQIIETAVTYGLGIVSVEVIERINILQASLTAMKQAVENCDLPPDLLLIDGNQNVDHSADQWTLVGGDGKSLSIAAASVLAKVTRDRIMQDYHQDYPQYQFDRHKGYPTKRHREAIKQFGPCPLHRKTFRGVKEFLNMKD
ncbi:MAG: ribonuclease HII [Nitrospinae bacterium]|jgi:ribonuclease HII|nr:ribonuclease HII [Nitrospinota bacterium]MDA1110652.1 ribonuclease HII [Nitrospinota bacterium]